MPHEFVSPAPLPTPTRASSLPRLAEPGSLPSIFPVAAKLPSHLACSCPTTLRASLSFSFMETGLKILFYFFLELQSWETSMTLFDDKERWLRRPENPRPLSDRDWNERRKLLHDLGNQITRYIALVRREDLRMKNSVARANPIQID